MERLTERKISYPSCDKNGNLERVDYIEIKDKKLAEEKLCYLEDIEEELGIDLITLFKAQTQGFYIINVSNKIEKVRLSEWRFNLIKKEVHRVQWNNHLLFADYGKTWSLTKEELER